MDTAEDKIIEEYFTIEGGDFPKWWASLSKEDKQILIKKFRWND